MSTDPAIPGDDPLTTATEWLKLTEDDECSIHPVHRSTVEALVASLTTARIAAAEARQTAQEVARALRQWAAAEPPSRHTEAALLAAMADRLDPGEGL